MDPMLLRPRLLSLTAWSPDVLLDARELVLGRSVVGVGKVAFPHISGKHCRLVHVDGKVMVQDLSRNGTFIDGSAIGRLRFKELCNGATLMLTPPGEQSVEAVAFVYCQPVEPNARQALVARHIHDFDIHLVKMLGKGSFGEVYLGVSKDGCRRAVKVVKKIPNDARLFEEVRVMDRLRHPHIVGIHRVWDSHDTLVMSLDLATGGDLEKLLKDMKCLSEFDAKSLLVQILNALAYLHAEHVIHRDLKPENILIKNPISSGSVPHLMLTDFGLSRIVHKHSPRANTVCGTPYYIAPEIVRVDETKRRGHAAAAAGTPSSPTDSTAEYDERVDVWSAGILLYRLLNGSLPWTSSEPLKLQILRAANPATPVPLKVEVSRACRSFLNLLIVDATHRLYARDAIKHEWFQATRTRAYAENVQVSTSTLALQDDEEEEEDVEDGEEEKIAHGNSEDGTRSSRTRHTETTHSNSSDVEMQPSVPDRSSTPSFPPPSLPLSPASSSPSSRPAAPPVAVVTQTTITTSSSSSTTTSTVTTGTLAIAAPAPATRKRSSEGMGGGSELDASPHRLTPGKDDTSQQQLIKKQRRTQ